jgi:uncharacterized membrane protein YfcA
MPEKQTPPENHPKRKQQIDNALKYSGIGLTLAVTMGVGAFIGMRLDNRFQFEKPYLTALCTVLALFAGLYLSLKDLLFNK